MPLFDYLCEKCGSVNELLMKSSSDRPQCNFCGSQKLKKLISAHSSISGVSQMRLPGAGDTGCCGSQPHQDDCEGPGIFCGKSSKS